MDDDNNNDCDCNAKCIGKCGAICIIALLFFIGSCWSTVEPLEYGLECNSFTKTCETGKSLFFI